MAKAVFGALNFVQNCRQFAGFLGSEGMVVPEALLQVVLGEGNFYAAEFNYVGHWGWCRNRSCRCPGHSMGHLGHNRKYATAKIS